MKKLLVVFIILSFAGCKKDDPKKDPPVNTNVAPVYAQYWGCWTEAYGTVGVYDIILTENPTEPHDFQFGTSCVPEVSIPALSAGVFRNDTLILDNGTFEYWCFVENDTLLYAAYGVVSSPEKFIKP